MENRQRKKNWLERFSLFLFTLLQKSFIGRFFTGYDKANENYLRSAKEDANVSSKRSFARAVEKNRLINSVPRLFQFLLKVSLRDYGIMMLMTGAIVTVLYPLNDMILFINVTYEMFLYSLATSLCAIPLLFSGKSLASNILASRFFSSILFDFFGFDRDNCRQVAEQNRVTFTNISFVIGLGLGVLAYFITPLKTIFIFIGIALAYSVLRTPEIGAVLTMLAIPFVDVFYLQIAIAYTFICYLIKACLNKRVFTFEYFDLWVVITIAAMSVFGLSYTDILSSLKGVAINLTLMVSYFLYSNLIRSKEWFRRCIVAFITATLISALVAIAQAILGRLANRFDILKPAFPFSGENVASTFSSSSVLGCVLVIAIPFALTKMITEKRDATKFAGFLLSLVLMVALFLTGSKTAIIGLIASCLLTFLIYNRNWIYVIFILVIGGPVLYFTLPEQVVSQILGFLKLSDVSMGAKLSYIKDAFLMIINKPLGIGLGENAVKINFPDFNEEYIDSLPLQIMMQYGVICFVIISLFVIMFVRLMLTYSAKAKNQYRRVNGCAGLCSLLALFLMGVFDYCWYDKKIFLLAIITIAASFAYIKIDRDEEVEGKGYIDITTASIEVTLKSEGAKEQVQNRKYVHAKKVKHKKSKKVEAKEFSNTEELIRVIVEEENFEEE